MRALIMGFAVACLAASFGVSAEAAPKNSAKNVKCDQEARASCAPQCKQAAYLAAYRRCMQGK